MLKKLLIIFIFMVPVVLSLNETCCQCQENDTRLSDNGCYVSISLATEKNVYNNSEKITFYNNLTSKQHPFVIQYWIEDSDGNIIKERVNTTNINAKSFTPKFGKPKTLLFKNELVSIGCNNTSDKLYSEKMVFVDVGLDVNPSIEILSFYLGTDNKVKPGNKINPKISVYTGNYSGNNLSVGIINLTSEINFELEDSFTTYEFKPELIIANDCSFNSGNYTFYASALGKSVFRSLFLENDCKEINVSNLSISLSSGQEYVGNQSLSESNINLAENPSNGQTIYSSAGIKAKKPMLYAFIAVALFMLFVLMPKGRILKDLTKNGIYNKDNNRSDRPPRASRKRGSFQSIGKFEKRAWNNSSKGRFE